MTDLGYFVETKPEPYPASAKPWLCKRCHFVVGMIRETSTRIDLLDVLRKSRETMAHLDSREVDPFAVESMLDGTAKCSHCGHSQEWHASDRALARMMARRKTRTFGLEPT